MLILVYLFHLFVNSNKEHDVVAIFLFVLVVFDGQTAFAAVLSVFVVAEKDTGAACFLWALFSFSLQFSDIIDFVELQSSQLDLGSLVLDLFWCGVDLLLSFSTTSQTGATI